MSAPNHGFAVMKTPLLMTSAYNNSPVARSNRILLDHLRTLLPQVKPELYRGIGRYPINADYDYGDPGWQWASCESPLREEHARVRLAEILGVNRSGVPEEVWLIDGPWLVPDLRLANDLMELLENRAAYEIVEVARYPSKTSNASLGFDVGYWASGNFSLICDTCVWPLWHPPDFNAKEDMKFHLSRLNDNQLFSNADLALEFRDWYKMQPWAEDESEYSLFEVVEIGLVGPLHAGSTIRR